MLGLPAESALLATTARRHEVAALRDRLGLAGRRLVVYTGNHDRRQGLPELIQALAAVRARHPRCLLLVVGGQVEARR